MIEGRKQGVGAIAPHLIYPHLPLAEKMACLRPSERGSTLTELVVVATIVVFLATAIINRVWFYQEQAEKTAMVEVVGVIQNELLMKYGHLMIRGVRSEIAALATDNPMDWLAKVPRNYAGEFYDPLPAAVTPGNWVFDLKSHELIYVLDRADYFVPGADGQKWIRYRVRLMYEPVSGVSEQAPKNVVGVLFEPVKPYRWFD
jgi:type II secretory pathway pseudopilin PulG